MAFAASPPHARLLSAGTYRPARRVSNEEVAHWISVPPGWVESRTGIIERRFAGAGEDIESMAFGAGRNALEASGLDPDAVDCVIFTTQSDLRQVPHLAPRLVDRLGIGSAGSYDIKASSAGFCAALSAARDHIRCGSARAVLVIACEHITQVLDRTDRDTALIFADGAGAVVVAADETPGVGPPVFGSDGTAADALATRPSWLEFAGNRAGPPPRLRMNGRDLARWLVRRTPDIVARALAVSGVSAEDLTALILHQANGRITDMIVSRLGLPSHVVVAKDIDMTGNTSAASVPLAMERLLRDGQAKPGGLALLLAYGAGITYAAQVVELPDKWLATDTAAPA
jgi:3-oxoacyl-(acyl-carrier-protein) synthase III